MSHEPTPRERVEAALRHELTDHVPFTVYECMIPQCAVERQLRNEGLCIVQRSPGVIATRTPGVWQETIPITEHGRRRTRTVIHTPAGDLTRVDEAAPGTSWNVEKVFKGPQDYPALLAMITCREHAPNYEPFLEKQEMMGEDAFLRAGLPYSPLQEIIYRLLGPEGFAVEWAERRDEVLKLYDALTEDRRKMYPIVAQSPALAANYGGNVSPEIVGLERFEQYVLPHYEEFADIMHEHGKLMGVHMDANNRLLAPAVARSKMDYVEAFTPPPDCDLSVAEARVLWPDKALWINFPSSVFLRPDEEIEEVTRQILLESAPGTGFLIGITEDMPPHRWQRGMLAISRGILKYGHLPIKLEGRKGPEEDAK